MRLKDHTILLPHTGACVWLLGLLQVQSNKGWKGERIQHLSGFQTIEWVKMYEFLENYTAILHCTKRKSLNWIFGYKTNCLEMGQCKWTRSKTVCSTLPYNKGICVFLLQNFCRSYGLCLLWEFDQVPYWTRYGPRGVFLLLL